MRQPAERSEDERTLLRRRTEADATGECATNPLPPFESPPRYLAKPGRASGLGRNVSGNPEATLGQPRQLSQPWRSSPLRDNPTGAILCAINRQSRVRGLDRARQLTEDRWRVDAARRKRLADSDLDLDGL